MNADAFRHVYAYHFAENRKLWDTCIMPLPQAAFVQRVDYSVGSVRNHVVHLMSDDDMWFSGLQGLEIPDPLDPVHFHDRDSIRAHWDRVEDDMRDYLGNLRDDMLFERPLDDEVRDLVVWQMLLHVVNHGTDHRAQLLRVLHDPGVKTPPQDYIFYTYEHPWM